MDREEQRDPGREEEEHGPGLDGWAFAAARPIAEDAGGVADLGEERQGGEEDEEERAGDHGEAQRLPGEAPGVGVARGAEAQGGGVAGRCYAATQEVGREYACQEGEDEGEVIAPDQGMPPSMANSKTSTSLWSRAMRRTLRGVSPR